MHNAHLHTGVTVLLSLLLVLVDAHASVAKTYVAAPLSTHVLNVTLNAAGWPTGSMALSTYVSSLTSTVNTTICGSLPSTVTKCSAFMVVVSSTSSPLQVAVQASVQTASYSAGNSTYTLFSQWAAGTNLFSLSELSGSLFTPTYTSGTYTVPCREPQTYAFLPACSATETPSTTVYVQTTSSGLQSTFLSYLCPGTSRATCTASVTVTSSTDNYKIVTITGASRGLEAVLAFVADARASYLGPTSTTSAIPGEIVGSSSAQLAVTAVVLEYRTVRATLFSSTENQRTYMTSINLSLQCESSYSMWAIAFVVIPFLAIGLFRYVWYRGRHRAKKHERRRIVEDETRIMQGYTSPSGTLAPDTAPPPGVDTSAVAPQWVMDENGNYYDSNATAAAATAADDVSHNANINAPPPGAGGTSDVTYQTWVDPATGETYQYVVDNTATAADTAATQKPSTVATKTVAAADADVTYQTYVDPTTGETYQYVVDNSAAATGDGTADASKGGGDGIAAAAGDGDGTYQTYVDPATGETYQYTVDNAAGAEAVGNTTQQAVDSGGDGNVTYQTYVDPETGETYQYAVDAGRATARGEPAAQASAAAAGTAADGYQIYVDPETGETYQYATADAGAVGQQYEYVDPNTGETYVYDAAAVEQGDSAADATGGKEAGADATVGGDASAGANTYVDPNAGETYQYVDAETGKTYEYQAPPAAQ